MLGGFSNVEGVDLRLRGKDPVVTPVDQLGVPTYDELVLVAQREQLEEDPEAIRLFLAALARGTAAAVDEPAGRDRGAARSQPRPRPEADRGRGRRRRCRCSARRADGQPYGYMDPAEWEHLHRLDARQRPDRRRCRRRAKCSATPTCRARSPNSSSAPSREQAGDLRRRQRPREEVALGVVAAEAAQLGELRLVLDPLGDHVERERPGHADDRLDDRRRAPARSRARRRRSGRSSARRRGSG